MARSSCFRRRKLTVSEPFRGPQRECCGLSFYAVTLSQERMRSRGGILRNQQCTYRQCVHDFFSLGSRTSSPSFSVSHSSSAVVWTLFQPMVWLQHRNHLRHYRARRARSRVRGKCPRAKGTSRRRRVVRNLVSVLASSYSYVSDFIIGKGAACRRAAPLLRLRPAF